MDMVQPLNMKISSSPRKTLSYRDKSSVVPTMKSLLCKKSRHTDSTWHTRLQAISKQTETRADFHLIAEQ